MPTQQADLTPLPQLVVHKLVADALAEDWGRSGDVTSQSVIPAEAVAHAVIRARETGIVAGLDFVDTAFRANRSELTVTLHKKDGDSVAPGDDVATITGPARALLAAERVALNYLGHLSGIASKTAQLVALVGHTKARICDTRKTTPGLRAAEKFAVRAGGGDVASERTVEGCGGRLVRGQGIQGCGTQGGSARDGHAGGLRAGAGG